MSDFSTTNLNYLEETCNSLHATVYDMILRIHATSLNSCASAIQTLIHKSRMTHTFFTELPPHCHDPEQATISYQTHMLNSSHCNCSSNSLCLLAWETGNKTQQTKEIQNKNIRKPKMRRARTHLASSSSMYLLICSTLAPRSTLYSGKTLTSSYSMRGSTRISTSPPVANTSPSWAPYKKNLCMEPYTWGTTRITFIYKRRTNFMCTQTGMLSNVLDNNNNKLNTYWIKKYTNL